MFWNLSRNLYPAHIFNNTKIKNTFMKRLGVVEKAVRASGLIVLLAGMSSAMPCFTKCCYVS